MFKYMQHYEDHKYHIYPNIRWFPFLKLKFRENNFYKLVKKNGDSGLLESLAALLDEWYLKCWMNALLSFSGVKWMKTNAKNMLQRGDI